MATRTKQQSYHKAMRGSRLAHCMGRSACLPLIKVRSALTEGNSKGPDFTYRSVTNTANACTSYQLAGAEPASAPRSSHVPQ